MNKVIDSSLLEPFIADRSSIRILFDFSAMISLLKPEIFDKPLLDFGSGSGWISEICVRMGLKVVAFDIHLDLERCISQRLGSDSRLDKSLASVVIGDGHKMPFQNNYFGHTLCFDTLHHMHDYNSIFQQLYRVLIPGGRALFVEPGARHSTSAETIKFLEFQKMHDPSWIERDVKLDEIDEISKKAGFLEGVKILPMPHPLMPELFSWHDWNNFRFRKGRRRDLLTDQLAEINYWERVIFMVEKPAITI